MLARDRLNYLYFLGCLALSLGLARSAWAQQDDPFARGIDLIDFKLGATLDRHLTIEAPRTPTPGSKQLELTLDWAKGLLAFKEGDRKLYDLVPWRLDAHVTGSMVVLPGLEVAVDMPFTLHQTNTFAQVEEDTGFTDTAPNAAGLGDLRLLTKWAPFQEKDFPVGVALVGELRLPTGNANSFMGDHGVVFAPRLVVERELFTNFRLAVEAGYRLRPRTGRYINLMVGDQMHFGAGAGYALPPWGSLTRWGVHAELLTATPARAAFTSDGAEVLKTSALALVGVRAEISNRWQVLFGVGKGLSARSGLGREAFRVFVTVSYKDIVDENDRDRDGIINERDACPDDPGLEKYDGCPDRDGDEIPDREDDRPDEPGPASNNGCPLEEPLAQLEAGMISLRASITFAYDRAIIRNVSHPVVDRVASILLAHPELKRIRVEGHTDSEGASDYNRRLSQMRAESVMNALIERGVAKERLEAKGFGEDAPISTNETARGRAANRRVMFIIVETDKGPAEPPPNLPPEDAGEEPAAEEASAPTAPPPLKGNDVQVIPIPPSGDQPAQ